MILLSRLRRGLCQGSFFGATMLFVLCASRNAIAGGDEADLKKLQGDWVIIVARTGDPNRDAMVAGAWYRFDEDTWQLFNAAGDQETGRRPFKLLPKEKPKEIDLFRDKNTIQARGIYFFEKDQLKLCWGPNRDSPRLNAAIAATAGF
jgi:uncharacterized protein (TIGR03067 family)